LILGCTHYPIMHKEFQKFMGKKVKVFDTGEAVARSLKEYLARHPEIEKKLTKSKSSTNQQKHSQGKRLFLTTDDPGKLKAFAEQYLGQKIKNVEKIELK